MPVRRRHHQHRAVRSTRRLGSLRLRFIALAAVGVVRPAAAAEADAGQKESTQAESETAASDAPTTDVGEPEGEQPQAAPPGPTTPETSPSDSPRELTPEEKARMDAYLESRLGAVEEQRKELSALRAQLRDIEEAGKARETAVDDATTSDARSGRVETGDAVRAQDVKETSAVIEEFPGAIEIPGTQVYFRLGGFVRLNVTRNWTALGSDTSFIVASIPVEGTPEAGKGERTSFTAAQSRLAFDFRMPSGMGLLRAFTEADFAGSGSSLRLRHAYGQAGPLLVGQTWTTFSNVQAFPEVIDFEGLDGMVFGRQPQVRGTFSPARWFSAAIALEASQIQVTGGTPAPAVPDAAAHVRFLGDWGVVQIAGVGRHLRVESPESPGVGASTVGSGVSVSAWIPLPFLSEGSDIAFQVAGGRGIARYITGPSSAASYDGGRDVIYDAEQNVARALPVAGGYVALRYFWLPILRSTLTYSGAVIANFEGMPATSYAVTHYASLNLIVSPVERLDIGAEVLAGSRTNEDGASGAALQTQIASTLRF